MLTNIIVVICAAGMIGAGVFAMVFLDRSDSVTTDHSKKENKKK